MSALRLAVIFAVADNGVIGRDNALPWHIPEDLRYFKQMTLGKPVLMGRKTFESIGRPLPGRTNIVISRDPEFTAAGVLRAASLDAALALAAEAARGTAVEEAVVIGGAEIYRLAIPLADLLYVTEVHARVEGDAVLPPVAWEGWRQTGRETHPAAGDNPYAYSFVTYERLK